MLFLVDEEFSIKTTAVAQRSRNIAWSLYALPFIVLGTPHALEMEFVFDYEKIIAPARQPQI